MNSLNARVLCISLLLACTAAARADYVTQTWGNADGCVNKGVATLADGVLKFDLSALPKGATVYRAVLRPEISRRDHNGTFKLQPLLSAAGAEEKLGPPLELIGPWFRTFDATEAVRTADPKDSLRLKVVSCPGLRAETAVLEVSFDGKADRPTAAVTGLKALHQAGQTFLTFKEIDDPVGDDAPLFEKFHESVMGARGKRSIVYHVYQSDKPITAATLGAARRVTEVPDIVSIWNLKAVRVTEHPNQGTPTMSSPLRAGYNNARNHVMTRYLITNPAGGKAAEALPRGSGLAVVTCDQAGKRYYAVTAAVNGVEAVAAVESVGPVDEQTSKFPAIIFQRAVGEGGGRADRVDVYNSWVGPPYNNVPTEQETYIVRWADLPEGSPDKRLPLWVATGTYGSTATELQGTGWWGARKYLTGAFTVGLAEGGIWQGSHECLGTLKSFEQGKVWNYPQRRVLAAAAWGVWKDDFYTDPQRVYFWSQLGSWALRHGDVFAVVMSNGYGNLAIGKLAQNYASYFGPGDLGSMNETGVPQWEYANLAKWIRENPTVELPYWICSPAYGAYPAHTIGDFGFMPWPETIHAMHSTKRAFAATWNSNGPGVTGGLLPLVTRIRKDQSLPAFNNCSLDASPGDGDHDDSEKTGGINIYQIWEPETIVDEPNRWEITLQLRKDCPAAECITDVTPRRTQKFKAKPGDKFLWTVSFLGADGKTPGVELQNGPAVADQWGLVTCEKVKLIDKGLVRLKIEKK